MHARSGLNMRVFRAYSSSLGRFINRDPIGENAGANLYAYVDGDPILWTDPSGLIDWVQVQNAVNIGVAVGTGVGVVIGATGGAVVAGVPTVGVGATPGGASGAVIGGALGELSVDSLLEVKILLVR